MLRLPLKPSSLTTQLLAPRIPPLSRRHAFSFSPPPAPSSWSLGSLVPATPARRFLEASRLSLSGLRELTALNSDSMLSTQGAGNGGTPTPSPSPATPDPAALRQRVQAMVNADHKGGWDQAWQQSMTPWDMGQVTPAVAHLIETGTLPAEAKTVFVPGCGTGYDVLAFSEGGKRRVLGLDISETALARARQNAEGKAAEGAVMFLNADFFTFSPEEPFDVIFDYTFFCAIHPSMRTDWGKRTAANLAPQGTLYTMAFPISEHEGGPPFAVSVKAYEDVLNPHGLFCEELPTVSHPSREGKEKMLKWTRTQSAKI